MHANSNLTSKIYTSGTYFPEQVVKSDDLFDEIGSEAQYDMPRTWMSETMGIVERRMSDADAKPSDLAVPAAKSALQKLDGVSVQDIDLVIFCGIERDQPEPATAHTIQHKLGLNARYAFDIANACFGFIDAMQIATSYVNSGIVKYALVVTGETPTKVLRAAVDVLKRGVDIKTARNIIGALSVGDAGGAVVIGPTEKDEDSGFKLFNTVSFSDQVDKCRYNQRDDGSFEGHMIMGQLAGAFVRCHRRLISKTLEQLGWPEFDWMLTHQIGQKPFDILSNLKGVEPSKMIKTLDKFGNITSATFPANFDKLMLSSSVEKGQKIGGCFAGSGIVVGQFGYVI